jgi:hypothetical protein
MVRKFCPDEKNTYNQLVARRRECLSPARSMTCACFKCERKYFVRKISDQLTISGACTTPRSLQREAEDAGPEYVSGRIAREGEGASPFSGLIYVRRLQAWKQAGYRIEMVYLRLRSTQLAVQRIAVRVRQGGHHVPRVDVVRRFSRGWVNFQRLYRPLADSWAVYDNSGRAPRLLEKSL